MGSLRPSRSDHRHDILSEIHTYQTIQGQKTVDLANIKTLLARIADYIRSEPDQDAIDETDHLESGSNGEDDDIATFEDNQSDFGDVEDDELMLAETTDIDVTASGNKRAAPSEFDNDLPSKQLKIADDGQAVALAESILQKTWGFPKFRLKQEQAISRLISGGSAAVVFPTGGGKSLVYQIPALAFNDYDKHRGRGPGNGVTLVVSPLIALMKDQVDALRKRGVSAAAMDSSQSRDSWLETCDKLRKDELKLLYVAPERLNNETFIEMINHTKIRLLAIDEAHCISEWGHAFRPDYLKIARFAKEIQAERILCLTATATPRVAEDICSVFDIDTDGIFRTTTYRPNLHLLAKSFAAGSEKAAHLKSFFREHKGPSIVYVQTHDQTGIVCTILKNAGFNAHSYHAGMANDVRTAVQDKFMSSDEIIIVATIAFGMGIDKANIRNIVHYAVPKSLEGYSQEIGRAGRDGLDSTCMIYLCSQDIGIMEEWSRADVPSLRTVRGLVGEFLELHRHAKAGDIIERNLSDESREWDIRRNALDLLNAQMELRFELIRAVTPKYSEYKFLKTPLFNDLTTDGSRATDTIKKCSRTAAKWTHIDVDAAAKSGRFPREDAVRKLQEWNDRGAIDLKPSGVVNRFKILKDFAKSEAEKNQIITAIYEQIEARERSDMERVQQVISLITMNGCLTRELAKHFGDEDSIPSQGCGHCSFCITKKAIEYLQRGKGHLKKPIDESKIKAVLSATKVRDDARFLARVAFGISSPRVTAEKLGKHEVFGSMADCIFEELVKRFNKVCNS